MVTVQKRQRRNGSQRHPLRTLMGIAVLGLCLRDVAGRDRALGAFARPSKSPPELPTFTVVRHPDGLHLVRVEARFSDWVSLAERVAAGTVSEAVRVVRREADGNGQTLTTPATEFAWQEAAHTLVWTPADPGAIPPGWYDLFLTPSAITDRDGNPLSEPGLPELRELGTLQTAAGAEIGVEAYSVPCFGDLDGDGLPAVIVGEKSGSQGRVRVYHNIAPPGLAPQVADFTYALLTSNQPLTVPASGCLGALPRLVDWNADGRTDLLVGLADGTLRIFLQQTPGAEGPRFADGVAVTAGPTNEKTAIDVGDRAAPALFDWDGDGLLDLLLGNLAGDVWLYQNHGAVGVPDLAPPVHIAAGGTDIAVPSGRAVPTFADLDRDGLADLVLGNTEGQLLFCRNTGVPGAPRFAAPQLLAVNGVAIDLAGTPRSRPFAADVDADGLPDLLVGALDGLVRRYEVAAPTNATGLSVPFFVATLAAPTPIPVATPAPFATDVPADAAALWDFGDGTPTSAGAAVTHTYDAAGTYTGHLTIRQAGAAILEGTFQADVEPDAAPEATIAAVLPSPRHTPVETLTVSFSRAVTGLDLDDFHLTRDGDPVALTDVTLAQTGPRAFALDLHAVTVAEGAYLLTLNAEGSGIVDSTGQPLAATASAAWITITSAPILLAVLPLPGTPATALDVPLQITFSEAIAAGSGAIRILNADGSLFESVTPGEPNAGIVGDTLTIAHAPLMAGSSYSVLADHDCVRNLAGAAFAGIVDPAAWSFRARPWQVTFSAGPGGTLSGATNQEVNAGSSALPVTAIPDVGYVFSQWSDGATANPRTEHSVTEDRTFTAQFRAAGQAPPTGSFLARVNSTAVACGHGLWDVTGSYVIEVAGNPLGLDLMHGAQGELTGLATYTAADATPAYVPVRGRATGSNGCVTISVHLRGGNATGTVRVALTLRLALSAAEQRLNGWLSGSVDLNGATVLVSQAVTLPMPPAMDGTWALRCDLQQHGRSATGDATLTLSNGAEYPLAAAGKIVGVSVALHLTSHPATPAAKGIRMRTLLETLEGAQARLHAVVGRGYGQAMNW